MNHISRSAWRQPRHCAIAIGPLALFNICTATANSSNSHLNDPWALILIQNPSDILGQYISCLFQSSDPHFKPLVNPITLLGVVRFSKGVDPFYPLKHLCTYPAEHLAAEITSGNQNLKTAITSPIVKKKKKGHYVMVTDNRIQWLVNQKELNKLNEVVWIKY